MVAPKGVVGGGGGGGGALTKESIQAKWLKCCSSMSTSFYRLTPMFVNKRVKPRQKLHERER